MLLSWWRASLFFSLSLFLWCHIQKFFSFSFFMAIIFLKNWKNAMMQSQSHHYHPLSKSLNLSKFQNKKWKILQKVEHLLSPLQIWKFCLHMTKIIITIFNFLFFMANIRKEKENHVDIEKLWKTSIWLQKSALVPKRTSPPKLTCLPSSLPLLNQVRMITAEKSGAAMWHLA